MTIILWGGRLVALAAVAAVLLAWLVDSEDAATAATYPRRSTLMSLAADSSNGGPPASGAPTLTPTATPTLPPAEPTPAPYDPPPYDAYYPY